MQDFPKARLPIRQIVSADAGVPLGITTVVTDTNIVLISFTIKGMQRKNATGVNLDLEVP
ncbi:MAG: hypothetical protein ABJP02_10115 [Parasphingorhabdus sp.]|uniref:hypothetical protein n=1 Tax=Parasphingorhabdus sp. TaxID=2709688 RepID=UPI003298A4FC